MATDMALTITMSSGEVFDVEVGNPDRVRWDLTRARKGWPQAGDAAFLMTTFMAWAALVRTQRYSGTWDQFSEQDCVALDMPDDEDTEGEPLTP